MYSNNNNNNNNIYDEDNGDISPSEDYTIVNQPRDLRDSLIQDEEQFLFNKQFIYSTNNTTNTNNNNNNNNSYIHHINKKSRVDNSNNTNTNNTNNNNNNNNNRISTQLAISQKLKQFANTLLIDSKHNEIPDVNIISPPTQKSPVNESINHNQLTNQDFDMTVELKTLIEEPIVIQSHNNNNNNNRRSIIKRNPTPVQNAIHQVNVSSSSTRELNTDEDFFNAEWDITNHTPIFTDQNSKFQRKAYAANSQVKHEYAASDERKHSSGTRKGRGGKKVGFSSSLKEVNLSVAKPPQPIKPQQQSQQVRHTNPSSFAARQFDLDLIIVKKEPNTFNKDDIEETVNNNSNNNNNFNNSIKLEPRSNSPPKTPEKRGMKDWMMKESSLFELTSPSSNNYTNSSGSSTYNKKGELQLKPRSGPLTTRLFRLIEAQNSASHILEHKARLGETINTIDYSRSLIVRTLSISNHYSLNCCIGLLCSPYNPQVVNLGDKMQQSAINQSINAKQYTHSTSSTAYWSVVSLELLEEYAQKYQVPLNLLCIVFFRPDCASRLRLRENQYVKLTWPWLLIEEIITKDRTIKTILNTFDCLEFDSQQGLIQENLQIQREKNQLTEAEIQSFVQQYSSNSNNISNNVESHATRNLQSKRALIEESGRNELLSLLNCFPEEDTRILTDHGWLFLDQLQSLLAKNETILYAAYDKDSKTIVYSPGKLIVNNPISNQTIINFTEAIEAQNWGSNPHGHESSEADGYIHSNHLSIRVTPNHDMFVQLGNKDKIGAINWSTHNWSKVATKMKATDLINPHKDNTAYVRMISCAEEGLDIAESNDLEFANALGLNTSDQIDAFLELYGFWLGDGGGSGSMHYNGTSISFSQVKPDDNKFIIEHLNRIGLKNDIDYLVWNASDSDRGEVPINITNKKWFNYFNKEYGLKYTNSNSNNNNNNNNNNSNSGSLTSCTSSSVSNTPNSSSSSSPNISRRNSVNDFPDEMNDGNLLIINNNNDNLQPILSHQDINFYDIKSAKWFFYWVFKHLGKRRLRLLLEGLRRADGSWTGNRFSIYTSSIQFRDELLQVLIHAGYSAYFTCYRKQNIEVDIKDTATKAFTDGWLICYCESTSHSGKARCFPSMARKDIKQESNYSGRTWCISIEHKDKLIWVQRAHRIEEGVVTKASRPIIIGNCIGEENLERELFGDQDIKTMDIDQNKDQNNKELMEIANSQPVVRVFKQISLNSVNNFNLSLTDQTNSTERKFIAGIMQKISLCGATISQTDQNIQNHPIFTLESSLPYIIIRDESGIAMISIPLALVHKFVSLFCCGNPNNMVIYFTNLAVNRANLFIGTSTINSYLNSYSVNSTRLVQLIVTPSTRFTVSNAAESLQIDCSNLFRQQSHTPLNCLVPSEICKFSINSRVNILARIIHIEWVGHEYCLLYLTDPSLHTNAANYTTSTIIVKFNVLYHLKLLRSAYKDEFQSISYPFCRSNPIYLRDLLIDQTNPLLVADCFSDILIPNITESNEFHNSTTNNDNQFPRTVEDCLTHEILQLCIYSISSSELPISCTQLYNFIDLLIPHPVNPFSISPTLQQCGLFNLKGQIIDILSELSYSTECVNCFCPLTSVESEYYNKILSKSNASVQILCPRCNIVNNSVTSTYNLLVKLKSDSIIEPINLMLNSYYIDKLLGHLTQQQIELAITNQDELVTFIRMQTIQCIAKIQPPSHEYQQLQPISVTEESMKSLQFISVNPTPFYISQ